MEVLADQCTTPVSPPGVREVRKHLPPDGRSRSTFKGVLIFAVSTCLYLVTVSGTIFCRQWGIKLLFASLTPVCAAALFVIGHDACHGSLTPRSWVNKVLGRLALLPSYHPYASWEHSHNGMHHAWTNVRGKDPVYVPFPLADYNALSPIRRLMERVYRTSGGLCLLYFIEIWWKHEMFPKRAEFPARSWRTFSLDRLMVFAFVCVQVACLIGLNRAEGARTVAGVSAILALGMVMPLAAWNWMMGFVTFLHHTHPRVPWYLDEKEWSFFAGQVQSVVHVEFPRPIELILHNIMEHTAHHVDPKIPLYNLTHSQDVLKAAYSAEIVTVKWTVGGFRHTLATCKLFDYSNHCWLDFRGRRTSPPLLSARPPLPDEL